MISFSALPRPALVPARLALLMVLVLVATGLGGCSRVGNMVDRTVDSVAFWREDEPEAEVSLDEEALPDSVLYERGRAAMDERRYRAAIGHFEDLEKQHPFSPLAHKAQVMVAYAYYKDVEYDDAILVIDRFVQTHPGNVYVPYMYYLKALSFYDRIADVKRDQGITQEALSALDEVIQRYGQTDYARDAQLKKDLVLDHLAGKEMEIGRFYLKDRKFVAAINRFKAVIDTYETTTHAPEALYRLVEAYMSLGIRQEAQKNAAVLGHNYPDSTWYRYAWRLVEEGAHSPLPGQGEDAWWRKALPFMEKEPAPLPKENKADSWFNRILKEL